MPRLITTPLTFFLRNRDVLEERVMEKHNRKVTYTRDHPNRKNYPKQREYYVLLVTYSKPFDKNWTNEEFLSMIVELDCRGNYYVELASLPDLPNCRKLTCRLNALTSLPRLDSCIELDCSNNALTSLGPLPKCHSINCSDNRIREIGFLPSCKTLNYSGNPITFIHPLPCGERITGDDYQSYNGNLICHWRTRWFYLKEKYFRLWYLAMLKIQANRRKGLHEELRFSPDTLIENEYTLAKRSFESRQT